MILHTVNQGQRIHLRQLEVDIFVNKHNSWKIHGSWKYENGSKTQKKNNSVYS